MKIIKVFNKPFLILFSFLPLSIVIGPSISLFNILILVLMYLYVFFYENHYKFLKNSNVVKLLFLIYLYLIINSILSINYEISLTRNLGFIRLILLFLTINYIFFLYENNSKIFSFWSVIIIIFVIDVYFERFTGTNIFGWGAQEINGIPQPNGSRVVSFFKDEPIAGAYLNGFIFLISGYLISKNKDKKLKSILYFIVIALFYLSVVASGERSNAIKATCGIIIFFVILDFVKTRYKIFIFTALIGLIVFFISSSNYLKNRYIVQMFYESREANFFQENIYIKLYKSGLNVFKNYPIFGVGNKNYRIESCKDKKDIIKYDYQCTTHPHQIYIELLAEHGIVGTLILLSIFFFLIFKNLKIIILSKNYIQVGCFINLLINFTPLIPSGSFFSDFNITLFFINFSLLYAANKKTNIFFMEKAKLK